MRRIVWSRDALDAFGDLLDYIARDNPVAARDVADQIDQAVQRLAVMPIGRKGRVAGTYEKPISGLRYIIAYALADESGGGETLTILRIIHSARDWPDDAWPT